MAEIEDNKSNINLRDIKSSYNIKRIFSFLYEKQKLKMIVYSKELQKMFSIGIEDYKKISGKYKIIGKNGKVKEFIINTDKLIFEGEYLDGKRNRKGKEYDNGKIIFEGEYLNGQKYGKGKEYYYNGELKFYGNYLNGKKWNGKGYNKNGNIDYIIKEGKGHIKEYNIKDKIKFDGEYLNGERNGKGKEFDNGKRYLKENI